MATSSLVGGAHIPTEIQGDGIDALGPSDSSDSGSDVQSDHGQSALPDAGAVGAIPIAHGSDTDSAGTGERISAGPERVQLGADTLPDREFDADADAGADVDDAVDPDNDAV